MNPRSLELPDSEFDILLPHSWGISLFFEFRISASNNQEEEVWYVTWKVKKVTGLRRRGREGTVPDFFTTVPSCQYSIVSVCGNILVVNYHLFLRHTVSCLGHLFIQ